MCNQNYQYRLLPWDTDYFGIKSGRVDLYDIVNEEGQKDIIGFCENCDFVTISNLNNIKENNFWIGNKINAFLTDVNIQFIKKITVRPVIDRENTYVLTNYPKNKQVIKIASESFQYSRFFNDPKLPNRQAQNIYVHWTECAFEMDHKYFAIYEQKNKVVGFILFSISETSSVIELIAVDKNFKGQGIGKSLIQTMESFIFHQGIHQIKVGTQIDNISAFNFYLKMGFTYQRCGSIYHIWKNNL